MHASEEECGEICAVHKVLYKTDEARRSLRFMFRRIMTRRWPTSDCSQSIYSYIFTRPARLTCLKNYAKNISWGHSIGGDFNVDLKKEEITNFTKHIGSECSSETNPAISTTLYSYIFYYYSISKIF